MSKQKSAFLLLLVAVVALLSQCKSGWGDFSSGPHSDWKNVYDSSASYVGMETCRGCHSEIYKTFIETGMGKSFGLATRQKSAADFEPKHAVIYDKELDYYYKAQWQNDSLFITEFRLNGRDTIHKRREHINYIVGSGQYTNSHIWSSNGYLYQAPITFYTQKQQWDLAPGFEGGASTRFNRIIQSECMTCHNGLPGFEQQSLNKYTNVKTGIDCERCHGPGSLHVAARQNGLPVDTGKTPDYTIVNPRRLSTELQNNICQRCHLQGIAVLEEGKTFFDFRPGMRLSEVMNVFMPQYEGARDKMIMASHVERMKLSNCYAVSEKMSCITCHNPHISVKFTPRSQYIMACNSCHGAAADVHCSETEATRAAAGNDCITCHMPRNGAIDIPHVAVTDHYIRKRPQKDTLESKITAFLGMRCFNNDNPGPLSKARAFMEFYERYTPNNALLDSAVFYINMVVSDEEKKHQNRDYIRVHFLLQHYDRAVGYAKIQQPTEMRDAWTAYRVGESYSRLGKPALAETWLRQAVKLMPLALDFQVKLGDVLTDLKKYPEAEQTLQYVLAEDPKKTAALASVGYLYMQQNNLAAAQPNLLKAFRQDPDREQNALNLAIVLHLQQEDKEAKRVLKTLLYHNPKQEQAKAMLAELH